MNDELTHIPLSYIHDLHDERINPTAAYLHIFDCFAYMIYMMKGINLTVGLMKFDAKYSKFKRRTKTSYNVSVNLSNVRKLRIMSVLHTYVFRSYERSNA